MIELITLIQNTEDGDSHGDLVTTETAREVLAELSSIGQKEFYEAHAKGLKPELKFTLTDYLDYEGETLVEYNGKRYRVLRTFRNGQKLELILYSEVNPE